MRVLGDWKIFGNKKADKLTKSVASIDEPDSEIIPCALVMNKGEFNMAQI